MTDRLGQLRTWLGRPVDGASLVAFRVLFGSVLALGLVRFLLTGWIRPQYVEPGFFFKYPLFDWVRPWSESGMYLHYGVLALLALCVAAGAGYRVAALLFTLGFAWVQLIDVTNYLNHYYLVVLLGTLLVFLPLNQLASVDAWLRPSLRRATVPAWALYLLRFQVAVVYVNAGRAKLSADWLLHAQPLGIWMNARTGTPLIGNLLAEPWIPYVMSWSGFLFDTLIVVFLSWRRTRLFAYGLVVLFHSLTHVFFDIGLFPFLMTVGALVFFPPDWPRTLWARLTRRPASPVEVSSPPSRLPAWGLGAIAAFCLVQLLLPLRHLAYDGNVLWTEQGMRWSWKVMVREKNGSVTYQVRSRDSGRVWRVNPAQYLTLRQMNEMSGQPDLILQLAHHIAQDFQTRGVGPVEVRAEAWVSLNGRPPRLLIDPDFDLTSALDGVLPAEWILPGPDSPPLAVGRRTQP